MTLSGQVAHLERSAKTARDVHDKLVAAIHALADQLRVPAAGSAETMLKACVEQLTAERDEALAGLVCWPQLATLGHRDIDPRVLAERIADLLRDQPSPAIDKGGEPSVSNLEVVIEEREAWGGGKTYGVIIRRGVQSFPTDYDAEVREEAEWYAEQLCGVLGCRQTNHPQPAASQPVGEAGDEADYRKSHEAWEAVEKHRMDVGEVCGEWRAITAGGYKATQDPRDAVLALAKQLEARA